MLSRRFVVAFIVGVVATIANADTAFAQRTVTVTNNTGMPINVQIGPSSFALKSGGVAGATLNTTRPPVNCLPVISAAATFTNGTRTVTKIVNGKRVTVTEPVTITNWANPVQTNICSGGRTSFSVSRSGQTLRIN